jgi:carboxymethylenebutenolidase
VAHKAVVGKGLGASGFSAGAAGALLLSEREPDLVKAVVAFYGTAGQVDYSGARAAYLGHYAEVDEWEPIDEVRGTQEALRAAGCEVTFHTYPGVGHWFFEEDRVGHYDAETARQACLRLLASCKQPARRLDNLIHPTAWKRGVLGSPYPKTC